MFIALCDDSEQDVLSARDIIKNTLKELHVQGEIAYYLHPDELKDKLLVHKETADIIILDIDMPEGSGLELAEKFREQKLDMIIIFLTNHEEFVFKAFEFQPFRYIRKYRMNAELPLAIGSAVKVVESKRDRQVALTTDDGEMIISISEIMYIEADKRKTTVHLSNGRDITANVNITGIYDLIKSEKLISIHRSCLVNIDYIRIVKNDIVILKNAEQLVISRRRVKDVKQQLMKLWGDVL